MCILTYFRRANLTYPSLEDQRLLNGHQDQTEVRATPVLSEFELSDRIDPSAQLPPCCNPPQELYEIPDTTPISGYRVAMPNEENTTKSYEILLDEEKRK